MTDDLQKKVDRAVRLLQTVAKGYDGEIELGYSGGKDSDVILHLARRADIRIKPIYRNTTIDPPGTIAHVQEVGGYKCYAPKRLFSNSSNKKDCRHASVGSAAKS